MAAAAPADKERILNDSVPTFREAAGAVDPAGRRLLRMEGDQGPEGQAAFAIAMEDGVPLDRGHLGGKEPVSSEWRRLNLRSSPISRSFSTSFKRSRTSSAKKQLGAAYFSPRGTAYRLLNRHVPMCPG